jgi:origin recognition complex subunit 1
VNQVQGRYTDEFVWEEVYDMDNIHELIALVRDNLKVSRKRRAADDEVSDIQLPNTKLKLTQPVS